MSQITGLLPTLARADSLKSVDALKQAVNDGTIPGYIGVPMIADLIKKQQQAQGMAQSQPTATVEDQVYAQAAQLQNPQPQMPQQQMPPQPMPQQQMPPQQVPQPVPQQPMPQPTQLAGITGAQSNLPTRAMAGGGIVAFAGGGLGDEDYNSEDDEDNEEYYADIDSKNQIAKMIASQASNTALTDALMQQAAEQQGGYGYGVNPEQQGAVNQGITYKEPLPSGGSKGIQDTAFINKIRQLESRGRDYDERGNILTSPKGAMASMQTMPATLRDPGFGVRPAQDNSVEEMNRVGRDYGNAMLQRYGNPKDAAMAYNWGPGNVDKWIAGGRKGPVPGETRQYASNFKEGGIVQLAGGGKVPGFYNGTYIVDPAGSVMEKEKWLSEMTPWERWVKPTLSKATKAIGMPFAEATGISTAVPAIGGALSYGATNALSNATDEQLEQLQGDIGSDTGIAASMILQARKNEAAKPPALPTNKLDVSPLNISPAYIPDEASGPYIDGQPPIPKPATPLTEPRISAEEAIYNDIVKANQMREATNKSDRTMDNYLALIQAGLGMMGGTSPYAMANIGQGGSAGISYLANARKQQGLAERGLARNQMDLLTARQSMNTAKENRELKEKLGIGSLEEKHSKDTAVVQSKIDAAIAKAVSEDIYLKMQIPNLERKMSEAIAAGKPVDPKDEAEYNRLVKKKADIEAKIRRSMPLPSRPGALGGGFSPTESQLGAFNKYST